MSKKIEALQNEAIKAKEQLKTLVSSDLPTAEAKEEAQAVLDKLEESYRRTLAYLTQPR